MNNYNNLNGHNGNRFGGGFFGPFILGGITGSLLTNRPNNYNNYPNYYPYYPTYPYYPYPYPYQYY